jgi:L-asparaginase II
VTKTGAEGLQCVAVPSKGLGIVVKARDGAHGARSRPALVGWLRALDVISAAEEESARRLRPAGRTRTTQHRRRHARSPRNSPRGVLPRTIPAGASKE